jgi:hypothetical protein
LIPSKENAGQGPDMRSLLKTGPHGDTEWRRSRRGARGLDVVDINFFAIDPSTSGETAATLLLVA